VRHKLIIAAQWIVAIVVVGYASSIVAKQWSAVRVRFMALEIHWGEVILASLLVLGAYVILIETWRRVLAAWDTTLGWPAAAQIWFASSLGKYIPGNVWSIAALGVMARDRGASSVAAAGSSIIVNLLNLTAGLAVVLICGSRLVPDLTVFMIVAITMIGAAIAAPFALPPLATWICRVTGRNVKVPKIPPRVIWLSLAGTTLAWLAYGLAFRFFAEGMIGNAIRSSSILPYVAVYTGAYILGFITPVAPAGLGVREALLGKGLVLFGLMGSPEAVIVALTSRLWLTVLEVAPGLVALATSQVKTHTRQA
jgi:hypothetical protein